MTRMQFELVIRFRTWSMVCQHLWIRPITGTVHCLATSCSLSDQS